jgi:predicted DNA-binding transcriptional regulator YafY
VATDTGVRLRRLLAILAWLAQVGEASIDEVALRFDLTPEALVTELEMAACCGVPPYTPDQLMEIVVSDTTVSVHVGTALARPRRLTPPEGLALAASARALLAVSGSDDNGALSRALDKLDRALGGEEIEVELDAPPFLPLVREAVEGNGRLLVTYYSASTDHVSERRIAPRRIFASEGHWYVDAWCETAGDVRRFRIDRMYSASPVEGSASGSPGPGGGETAVDLGLDAFVPDPDSATVRISLKPGDSWLVESIPATRPPVETNGRVEYEFYVGGDAWLERLLLRLGPDARVVDPPEFEAKRTEAARRILQRYQ